MTPTQAKLSNVYLKPGEVHFSTEPSLVTTVLGSCISVTMFCGQQRFAGMCHVLLPRCNCGGGCKGRCGDMFRYLDCSVKAMIEAFEQKGIKRQEIEIKIFGGSDMFESKRVQGKPVTVGRQNIEMAKSVLQTAGLKVAAEHLGGKVGRKILFFTNTGEVLMKRLGSGATLESQ